MKSFRLIFKDRSLLFKFTLLFILPIILITIFIVLSVLSSLEKSMVEKTKMRILELTELSALSMSNTFVIYNKNLLDNFIDNLAEDKNVVYAMIVDSNDDTILAHSDHQNDGKIFDDSVVNNILTRNQLPSQSAATEKQGKIYKFSAPIVIEGREYGLVRVGFSMEGVYQEIAETRNGIITMAVIAIILGAALSIFLAHIISKPMKALAEQAEGIGAGNFEQKTIYEGKDALGRLASSFNKMAEELKSKISMLKEDEVKYRALFEASNNAVFIMDREKFLECNQQTVKMFGCAPEDIIGQSPLKFSPSTQPDGSLSKESATKKIAAAFRGEHQRFYWQHIRLDGSAFDAEVSLNLTHIANKPVLQAIVQDISQRKKAEQKIEALARGLEKRVKTRTSELEAAQEAMVNLVEDLNISRDELKKRALELEEMNVEIQEATRLKSQFLANMSHELRTPLNSIIGFTGIILQGLTGEISGEQRKQLNLVYGSAKHLLGLINDVLDLSKIEAGKIEIIPSEFEVRELIQTVENMVSPMLKEKGLTLQVAVSKEVPAMIYHDKNRIKQVLINLLSNATKFTESGQIGLTVRPSLLDAGGAVEDFGKEDISSVQGPAASLVFSVSDTGMGIKAEHLSDIFTEFKQIKDSLREKSAGTGLGLAICKKMVEMMGGRIWVESEYGRGSRFHFVIPLKETVGRKRPPVVLPETLDRSRKLVLTIDDESEAQKILKTYLKSEGYEVLQAYNGTEAMQLAKKYHPFAITLDIVMPGKDGWDILHNLKKDPQTEGIPVICISILDNREMGLSLGAIEYMVKPVDREQLIEELHRLEKRFRICDILIVDDDPHAVELLTEYLDREGSYMIRKAYGGEEGLSRVKESRPDLIILDLMMPEVDGFEVIGQLKKAQETSNIPIIIVSAKELTEEEVEFLNSNIEKIMRKDDFSKENLLRDVKRALKEVKG